VLHILVFWPIACGIWLWLLLLWFWQYLLVIIVVLWHRYWKIPVCPQFCKWYMYSESVNWKMGGRVSSEIPKKSTLGCILSYWKDIGGAPGGSENKKTLTKYCNQWWLLYKLECWKKWPFNGALNCNTLLQSMLFLRRKIGWNVVYWCCFSILEGKGMELSWPLTEPLVLALENYRQEKDKRSVKRFVESVKGIQSWMSRERGCRNVNSSASAWGWDLKILGVSPLGQRDHDESQRVVTETEKQLTLKTTWVHVWAQIADGIAQETVDNCIFLTDPH